MKTIRINKQALVKPFIALMLLCGVSVAQAESDKSNFVGVGTYAISAVFTSPYASDMNFSGNSVYLGHASESGAFRLGLYQAEDTDYYVKTRGVELQFLVGANMNANGLKLYIGPGYFSEKLTDTVAGNGFSGSISGFALVGGIGLNGDSFSVDLTVTARDTGAYDDSISNELGVQVNDVFADVITTSLVLSARF
jgi:hypothetical protein